MRLDGPVLLYGAGREARSTRRFLAEIAPDIRVDVCVDSGAPDLPDTSSIPVSEVAGALERHDYALVVRSAGVSVYKSGIEAAKAAGIPVTTNVNLWSENRRGGSRVIAITGTKGKSTTAKLTHEMLAATGIDAGLGGNIGVPPLDLEPREWIVLELSSYQTADLNLSPDLIGITTLYPEHRDWHRTTERYFADKLHILDMPGDWKLALGPQAAVHPDFAERRIPADRLLPALANDLDDDIDETLRDSRLKGTHNRDNAVLAARLAVAAGATDDAILSATKAFEPLPHRLQAFDFGGITAVDDSISTTPEATKAALAAYPLARVALIAGGHDRGQDYASLAERIDSSGIAVVACLPATGPRLAEAIRARNSPVEVIEADDLESAIRQLRDRRDDFDTLLLSPAAPSFGQFRNFEERGEKFVELARHYFDR